MNASRHDAGEAGYTGLAFRQCHPDHASIAETIRVGAAFPSRFTPPGGRFGVLYVALSPETAVAELHRRAEQLGVSVSALAPRTMLTLTVRLRRVLDLGEPSVRAEWGLDEADLGADDHTRCQEVALAARADGYEAIRYPSAARAHPADARAHDAHAHDAAEDNLAIFADRLLPGSDVRVVRHEPLPLDSP